MTFGQNVTKYREAQGLTKQTLARLSGVPVNSICRAEIYGTDVYLSTAIKLSKALGVGLTELAGDCDV